MPTAASGLTPADVLDALDLPRDERSSDGTLVRARTLAAVLRTIASLRGPASYAEIGRLADVGRNTVERAVQVLLRLDLLLPPTTIRVAGRVAGTRYRVHWTAIGAASGDDRLALFAEGLAAAELDPVANDLHPVAARQNPVGGQGVEFLEIQHPEFNSSPTSPSSAHGVQTSRHGVQATAFNRAEWRDVESQLDQAGLFSYREACHDAHSAGLSPNDVLAIVAEYRRHPGGWRSPGVIRQAIRSGRLPPPKQIDRSARQHAAAAAARESREDVRLRTIRELMAGGMTKPEAVAECTRLGLD